MSRLRFTLCLAVLATHWVASPASEAAMFMGLGDLAGGAFTSEGRRVSGDGSVVVGRSTSASGWEAFRWTSGGGMVGLGDLTGWTLTSANRISDDGSTIIGIGTNPSGDTEAWIAVAPELVSVPPLSPLGVALLLMMLVASGLVGLAMRRS